MEVLVKNPFAPNIPDAGLIPSFWSPECLYAGPAFSITSLFDLSDPLGLSPFLMIDPRVAFTVSQAAAKASFVRNLGALGTIALHFFSGEKVSFTEELKNFDKYVKEYLPHSPLKETSRYEQVVTFGESSINGELWNQLEPGGFYILATHEGKIDPGNYSFEPFGKLWPFGMPTEYGWMFDEADWGLQNFEFAKLKKLS